jgi:hypothetical protein
VLSGVSGARRCREPATGQIALLEFIEDQRIADQAPQARTPMRLTQQPAPLVDRQRM